MVENLIQIKRGIMINVGVSVKIRKNNMCAKKNDIWNPATCSCENGRIKKNCYNKANSNKFINFTSPFNNYHSIIGSC